MQVRLACLDQGQEFKGLIECAESAGKQYEGVGLLD